MAQRVKTDSVLIAMLVGASSVMSQENYKSSYYLVSRRGGSLLLSEDTA